MSIRTEAARTACLMQGMADHLSVDLAALIRAGRLSEAERDEMVTRCRACTKGDDCILWMIEHDQAKDAPGYCLNGEDLTALRDG
jgi:hypothetical protein